MKHEGVLGKKSDKLYLHCDLASALEFKAVVEVENLFSFGANVDF